MIATIAAQDYHLEIEEYNPLHKIKSSSTTNITESLTSTISRQTTTTTTATDLSTCDDRNTSNMISQSSFISFNEAQEIKFTTKSESYYSNNTNSLTTTIEKRNKTEFINLYGNNTNSNTKNHIPVSFDTSGSNPISTQSKTIITSTCETTTSNVNIPSTSSTSSSSSCINTTSTTSTINKKILVLDIDECIIHSEFLSPSSSSNYYRPICDLSSSTSSTSSTSSNMHYEDSFVIHMNDGESAIINKRPGLDEFLHKANKYYEIYAYTASLAMYSEPIISYLDPHHQIFKRIYYRDSCILSKTGDCFLKDLRIISNNLSNIILVDNNPMSFLLQPYNGIPVPSFYNNSKDHTLYALWKILDHIKDVKDVRPKLDQMFHLKDVLFHFRYHTPTCI